MEDHLRGGGLIPRRALAALGLAALSAVAPARADDLDDARARFRKGIDLTDQGNAREAIEIFTKLTQDYPRSPEPYNNLAVIYASQGQYEKARTALEESVRVRPNYAISQENLGDVYAKLASQAYDKASQLDASNSVAKRKLLLARSVFIGATPTDGPSAVLKTAQAWAQAWSRRDADAYLGHYAADFKTPDGEPRAAWEKMRRQRLAGARIIAVDLESPTVKMAGSDEASVSFLQSYRSQVLNTATRKTLVMTRVDGRWRIREEIVGR